MGVEKILYGSDFPLLPLDRYRAGFLEAGFDESEIAAVLGGNLAEMMGL